jgi:hypothetical protein
MHSTGRRQRQGALNEPVNAADEVVNVAVESLGLVLEGHQPVHVIELLVLP